VTGQTAWKTYSYFFGSPSINASTNVAQRPLDDTSEALRAAARRDRWGVLAFQLAAPIVAFALGFGWQYLVLWVLPLVTLLQAILRLRAICEHGAVTDFTSPLTAARTNLPGRSRASFSFRITSTITSSIICIRPSRITACPSCIACWASGAYRRRRSPALPDTFGESSPNVRMQQRSMPEARA
jgi:hypothetical protein